MRKILQVFGSNLEFSRGSWALVLPKNCSLLDEDGDVVGFVTDDGFGVLQLSSYIKDDVVSDSDLIEFSEEMGLQPHNLKATVQGDFTGFSIEATNNDTWWRSWCLRCNSTMIFATYNCEIDDRGVEDQLVEELLSSLTYKRQ
ncbi:hypothetical protein [uncultured Ruegeria sp.]|uniref:hypothetical protein n=1 Tax=uncultured Ruegeria sp. TaxID=259304 RepID=UPI002632DB5E|nr:hypothetical protein [uncultured Ruegeria sp.]